MRFTARLKPPVIHILRDNAEFGLRVTTRKGHVIIGGCSFTPGGKHMSISFWNSEEDAEPFLFLADLWYGEEITYADDKGFTWAKLEDIKEVDKTRTQLTVARRTFVFTIINGSCTNIQEIAL
jgi:hypothetical protein